MAKLEYIFLLLLINCVSLKETTANSFAEYGVSVPEILLPKAIDAYTWSSIACDQYTQDREYWTNAEKTVGSKPSTLNIMLPEIYLNDKDKQQRIEKIKKTMDEYVKNGIFDEPKKGFVYVERTTPYGRVRHGLVTAVDLESYEWKPFSKALIRATEATIVERIPPRIEIRKGAPLELPHIMLLVNDPEHLLVEGTGQRLQNKKPLYDGKLMMNGGSIKGWLVGEDADLNYVVEALKKLKVLNTSKKDGTTFLFAVGDGNHSLATAKAIWDQHKKDHPDVKDSPLRYALIEIVNIYDTGLTFEPIHRVLFNMDSTHLLNAMTEVLKGKQVPMSSEQELLEAVEKSVADFGFTFMKDGKQQYILLKTDITDLAVSELQPALDEYMKQQNKVKEDIDFIHGSEALFRLAKSSGNTCILLPPIAKDSFFSTIDGRGPLPRKTFSMGEADEKRFYLECRKLY